MAMDLMAIIHEFEIEGFKVQPLYPGFLTSKRRAKPRHLTFSVREQTVTLHDEYEVIPWLKPGEVTTFEVTVTQTGETTAAIAVSVPIEEPGDIAPLFPKLEAILNGIVRLIKYKPQ